MIKIPFSRSKSQFYLLAFLIAVSVIIATGLWKRIYIFSIAMLQGSTTMFANYKIHLGFDYVYNLDNNVLEVQPILPWFEGIEEINTLSFRVRDSGQFAELIDVCRHDPQNCEERQIGNYIARTYLLKNSIDALPTFNQFHSEKCNVYISHLGKTYALEHRAYIDNFFIENCN